MLVEKYYEHLKNNLRVFVGGRRIALYGEFRSLRIRLEQDGFPIECVFTNRKELLSETELYRETKEMIGLSNQYFVIAVNNNRSTFDTLTRYGYFENRDFIFYRNANLNLKENFDKACRIYPELKDFSIPDSMRNIHGNVICILNKDGTRRFCESYSDNGLTVDFFNGRNNTVIISEERVTTNTTIRCGSSCMYYIGTSPSRIDNLFIDGPNAKGSVVAIGRNCSVAGCGIKITDTANNVFIGEDCMLSYDILIWSGDGHVIMNDDGEVLNLEDDVLIGSHVWIGHRATILKGSHIGRGSIIGESAVVTKGCGENTVLAGNPARIVKEGIKWSRSGVMDYVCAPD